MIGRSQPHNKRSASTRENDSQTTKRLTRLLKTKIQKAIDKGDYDDALKEVKAIRVDDHWVDCKEAQIYAKMKKGEESLSICKSIRKKGQQCSLCSQLFNSLSQNLQRQQQLHQLREVQMNSKSRKNTLRSAQQNSPRSTQLPSNKSQFQQFLHHLRTNNCEFKNIQIVEVSPGHRIVKAKQEIQKDQTVILVPEKLMITVELAKQSKVGKEIQPIMNQLRSPKHSLLSLFLLSEQEKGKKSHFYYYLQILPKNLKNFPIFYSEELLGELKNTFFSHILDRKKQDLQEDFHRLQERSDYAKKISYQKFLRARMIISSRIFGIIINGNKTDALVPLADMLNHNVPKMTTWSFQDDQSAFIIKNIDGRIQKGQQIHDSYGCKCNSRFLLNYGFIQQNNPSNEVGVKLRDRENKIVHRMVRLTRDISSQEFDNLLGYSRLIIGNVQHSNRKQIEDDDVQEISPDFSSVQFELEMWKYIESEIHQQISLYPTSVKVDQKILKQKQLDYNYRKCVQIRLGEKQILYFYLNMSKAMISLFSGKGANLPLTQYKSYLRKIPYQRIHRVSD